MANPTCTRASLIAGEACLKGTVLKPHDQLVRRVYFDMLQLAAIGGVDYRSIPKALAIDGNTLSCGFKPDDFAAAQLVIAANNATAAGATVPTTRVALADEVKCLDNYSDYQLQQMALTLYCQLGRGKTYPQ